jgi:hypothetical protein
MPLHAASAAPYATQAPAAVTQENPNTTPPDADPDDAPWPGDDDEDNDSNDIPMNPIDQGASGEDSTGVPSVFPPEKGVTAMPDSVLQAKTTTPKAAGAGLDTLEFRPPGAPFKRPGAARAARPAERKPFFGLHPAVLFLGLLVGHIFVVRAVNE